MGESTTIEWTDRTWSPWEGCTKVGPGCDNCYAEAMNRWLRGGENWGPGAPRREYSEAHWLKPLAWHNKAVKDDTRPKVFPSVMDPFDNEVMTERRLQFLRVVMHTPRLTWLLLTKRIGNVKRQLAESAALARSMPCEDELANWLAAWLEGKPPENVWLGATVVNQEEADRDIGKLLDTPAGMRFLSMEPLLGAVDLQRWLEPFGLDTDRGLMNPGIDWVIVGGESGPKARPMHPDWARSLRDQCAAAGVPFLFKQWGEWTEQDDSGLPGVRTVREGDPQYESEAAKCDAFIAIDGELIRSMDDSRDGVGYRGLARVGKKAAGRLLDGLQHDGFPMGATR